MKHTYLITGMSCNGCRSHVEETLSNVEGVISVDVDLENAKASIEMEGHIPMERFQKALQKDGGRYGIYAPGHLPKPDKKASKPISNGTGTYYCPMHCEGDKTYNKPGDCPVCGMDLVEEQNLSLGSQEKWTCPMHTEVVEDGPGSCPKCGMDLVPMEPEAGAEEKTYKKLLKKFWIALAFTLPIFLIAMSDMLPNNPLHDIMAPKYWNWVQFVLSLPVVFYATWIFFFLKERTKASKHGT